MTSKRERVEQLFRQYYRPVFNFFLARGIRRDQCHDLAQETFARVWKGLEDFRGDAADQTWLFRIARNLWLNHQRNVIRRWRKAPEVPLVTEAEGDVESPPNEASDGSESPEQVMLRDELVARLRQALDSLPPQRKRCILLRLDDLKYREIAELLGLSLQTVRSHLFQGRQQLQQLMGSDVELDF